MKIVGLDGRQMTTREDAHRAIAEALHFPAYYGANLDALADCLSELGERTYVIFAHTKVMREGLGDYADRLLSVFHDCTEKLHRLTVVVL